MCAHPANPAATPIANTMVLRNLRRRRCAILRAAAPDMEITNLLASWFSLSLISPSQCNSWNNYTGRG